MEIERKDIEWYEGYYQVSNTWLVRSLDRIVEGSNWRKQKIKWIIKKISFVYQKTKSWYSLYPVVFLWINWIVKTNSLGRLVAAAFIRPLLDEEMVSHINWDTHNNHVDNLYIEKNQSCLINKLINKNIFSNKKKINQYSLLWEYIQTFNSIKEANIFLGKRKYNQEIGKNLRWERKITYWYIRKYAE